MYYPRSYEHRFALNLSPSFFLFFLLFSLLPFSSHFSPSFPSFSFRPFLFFLLSFFPDPPSWFLGFSYFFFSNLSTSFFLVCVCACVCASRMYVRAYFSIPCVSADDNVKHTKSNIRYDNKYIKWNKCEIYKNSCIWVHRTDVRQQPFSSRQKAEILKQIFNKTGWWWQAMAPHPIPLPVYIYIYIYIYIWRILRALRRRCRALSRKD